MIDKIWTGQNRDLPHMVGAAQAIGDRIAEILATADFSDVEARTLAMYDPAHATPAEGLGVYRPCVFAFPYGRGTKMKPTPQEKRKQAKVKRSKNARKARKINRRGGQ